MTFFKNMFCIKSDWHWGTFHIRDMHAFPSLSCCTIFISFPSRLDWARKIDSLSEWRERNLWLATLELLSLKKHCINIWNATELAAANQKRKREKNKKGNGCGDGFGRFQLFIILCWVMQIVLYEYETCLSPRKVKQTRERMYRALPCWQLFSQ